MSGSASQQSARAASSHWTDSHRVTSHKLLLEYNKKVNTLSSLPSPQTLSPWRSRSAGPVKEAGAGSTKLLPSPSLQYILAGDLTSLGQGKAAAPASPPPALAAASEGPSSAGQEQNRSTEEVKEEEQNQE